ncbi:16S rRNA (cytosine(1402)-N(4))-methyltransferase RsmH [Candidatus Kaiserbacteria bacterium]|nr:16S rRNA (cytosine(1402)-N(4))-methyltransferase RsmH [Candidatus Kaiserbacteria bacterium]
METRHITVLKDEAVSALNLHEDSFVVDATLGAGGHSAEILSHLGKKGMLIALDADKEAVRLAEELFAGVETKTQFVNANFKDIDTVLDGLKVDAILADLGWRIEQFAGLAGEKGFSFLKDEPLLMTYGNPEDYPFTAKDIVNEWSLESVANVIKGYGEEKFARRIARAVVEKREESPIETSGQLAEIVRSAVPSFYRFGRIDAATKTFQALRIAVNDELGILEEFIDKSLAGLKPGGRLAIITFNSLEDRIVKKTFRSCKDEGVGELGTKKPIAPSEDEVRHNPRARSAKLRIFIKSETA